MPVRSVAQRPAEGSRTGAIARGQAPRGRGGRPKGVKNKPKGLIPLPVAEDLIKSLQPLLPAEQMRYLRSVLKDGAALDTRRELDTLILLLNRSIWPALAYEAVPFEDPAPPKSAVGDDEDEEDDSKPATGPSRPSTTVLRKDVTDRLKVLNSLLNLRANLDKSEHAKDGDESQPILKLFAERGLETRIAILVGEPKPALPAGPEPIVIDQE